MHLALVDGKRLGNRMFLIKTSWSIYYSQKPWESNLEISPATASCQLYDVESNNSLIQLQSLKKPNEG